MAAAEPLTLLAEKDLGLDGFSQFFTHSYRASSKELGFGIAEGDGTKEKEEDDDDDGSDGGDGDGDGDEEGNTAAMAEVSLVRSDSGF